MEKLTELLEKLAVQLGVTVEQLYNVIVKQAAIEANFEYWTWIVFLVAAIICLIIFVLSIIMLIDDGDEEVAWGAFFFFATAIICGWIAKTALLGYYTCIDNPEYWALNEILSQL